MGEVRGGHRHAVAEGDIPTRGPHVAVVNHDLLDGVAGGAARAGHGQRKVCEIERSEVGISDAAADAAEAGVQLEAWVLEGQSVLGVDLPCAEDPRAGLGRPARAKAGLEIVDKGDGGRLRRGTQRSNEQHRLYGALRHCIISHSKTP